MHMYPVHAQFDISARENKRWEKRLQWCPRAHITLKCNTGGSQDIFVLARQGSPHEHDPSEIAPELHTTDTIEPIAATPTAPALSSTFVESGKGKEDSSSPKAAGAAAGNAGGQGRESVWVSGEDFLDRYKAE